MNIFWRHDLENKKPTFLACIAEQVYAAILESSKNNNLFQNHQIESHRIVEISLTLFLYDCNCQIKSKTSNDGRHLL